MDKQQFQNSINKLKEFQIKLKEFNTKEEAIKYLEEETKLSHEECEKGYEFAMSTDFSKVTDKDIDYML